MSPTNTRSRRRSAAPVQARSASPVPRPLPSKPSGLSAAARDILLAYAMTGSAVASLAIIAAPVLTGYIGDRADRRHG
jgi:hypothetical protein